MQFTASNAKPARIIIGLAVSACLLFGSNRCRADDGWGAVDGAIWRVKLTPQDKRRPKAKDAVPMSAFYRVEKLVLYQHDGPKDKEQGGSRRIGKSEVIKNAQKPTTEVEFTDFQVNNREEKLHQKISGRARLFKVPKEQKAEGVFVDSEGWKWDMVITRHKE